jgi:hypothetical protein
VVVALPHLRDLPEEKETLAASTCYPLHYPSESFHRLVGLHPAAARSRLSVLAVAGESCHRQVHREQEEEEQTVHERVHHHQEVEGTLGSEEEGESPTWSMIRPLEVVGGKDCCGFGYDKR